MSVIDSGVRGSLVDVTPDPIEPAALLARVQDGGHGAALLFVGTVRDYAREGAGEGAREREREAARDGADPADVAREGASPEGADPPGGPRDRPVSGMTYEAYEPMARSVLNQIVTEASVRFGAGRFAVVHRTGALEIGEVSVAIAVGTPHRAEAYEASRYIIEEIKKRVPIWKHEHYTDGEDAWVPGIPLTAEGNQ